MVNSFFGLVVLLFFYSVSWLFNNLIHDLSTRMAQQVHWYSSFIVTGVTEIWIILYFVKVYFYILFWFRENVNVYWTAGSRHKGVVVLRNDRTFIVIGVTKIWNSLYHSELFFIHFWFRENMKVYSTVGSLHKGVVVLSND
jgi:hypothetical protein